MSNLALEDKSDGLSVHGCSKPKTWIEVRVVDQNDDPVVGAKVSFTLPDGTKCETTTDDKGFCGGDNIDAAEGETCKVAVSGQVIDWLEAG